MAYQTLQLSDFRSYRNYQVELSPGVTIVAGPNGSGKTNLLEALYVLSRGTSFRVSDRELVRYGAQRFLIEGSYNGQRRALEFTTTRLPAKQFNLNGVRKQRLAREQYIPVVLFEPDELRLINGSPQRRRDYIDGVLAQLWPAAGSIKSKFERALLQRNNILKHSLHSVARLPDQLFVWDIKLAEYAQQLIFYRLRLIDHYSQALSQVYSSIAQKESTVTLRYRSEVAHMAGDYQTTLMRLLTTRLKQDHQRGFTSIGPHRDDLQFMLNGTDAAAAASRGEVRTLILALKMIEARLMSEHSTHSPFLLLDDVFSELDESRQGALAAFSSAYQTIITTTNADAVTERFLKSDHLVITPTR